MKTATITEAKNGLSALIDRVRAGESVLILDRGVPIARIEPIGDTFTVVALRFGFMETPNVPKALAIARKLGWQFDIMSTSFFLSRRSLKVAARSGMPRWQDRLFIRLARSANDATDYYQIPTGRVVEIGTQVAV